MVIVVLRFLLGLVLSFGSGDFEGYIAVGESYVPILRGLYNTHGLQRVVDFLLRAVIN